MIKIIYFNFPKKIQIQMLPTQKWIDLNKEQNLKLDEQVHYNQ